MSNAPGPGIYGLPSLLTTRKDFGRSVQGVFATPVAEYVEKTNGVPPPNVYNVSNMIVVPVWLVASAALCLQFVSQMQDGLLHKHNMQMLMI